MRTLSLAIVLFLGTRLLGQVEEDTVVTSYSLGEVVIHHGSTGLDVEGFIHQVMEDTSFHHAFINTKCLPHSVESELHVRNKHEKATASLYRAGRLIREGTMAELVVDSASSSGKLTDKDGDMRYLTARMYDDVFFPRGKFKATVGIASREQAIRRESRFDKYRSELKNFMFNPGQEITSVPFIGDKLALFDPAMVGQYDFSIDHDARNGRLCWVFRAQAKDTVEGSPADEDDTVIKRMITWFDQRTMNVMAREYRIARSSLILDFDISIKVENTLVEQELVPVRVDYDGVWDLPFQKPEIVRFRLSYRDWTALR